MFQHSARSGRAVAPFDSAAAMVVAAARALRPHRPGRRPPSTLPLRRMRWSPAAQRLRTFGAAAAGSGVSPHQLGEVNLADAARWVVDQYPTGEHRFPGVMIGSANGAAVHLCAAMGIPWLPQTVLLPVRFPDNDPDRPAAAMRFGQQVAGPLLTANPDVVLHHVHDGNHDRAAIRTTTWFRLKWHRLPAAYQRFIAERVAPGAPVLLLDCQYQWPTTQVSERHLFQAGSYGGLDPEQYTGAGPEVARFLAAQGSLLRRFDAPPPDGPATEAEWGFAPELADSVRAWAEPRGHPVRRIAFADPQALSAPVADLHQEWLRGRGRPAHRVLVESYTMLDPVAVARAELIPFWTVFPVRRAQLDLQRYVAGARGVRDLHVLAFPHGVRSLGWCPPECWDSLTEFVDHVDLPATDRRRAPADFRALLRAGRVLDDLAATLPADPPPPVPVTDVLDGLRRTGGEQLTLREDHSDQRHPEPR